MKILVEFDNIASSSKFSYMKNIIHSHSFDSIDFIIQYCAEKNINIILPYRLNTIFMLTDNKSKLAENKIGLLLPEITVLNIFNDKKLFIDFMKESNLENYVPKCYSKDHIIYPCIAKKRISDFGRDTFVAYKEKHLNKLNMDDYLIQEPIYGNNEYTTHILAKDGNIILDKTFIYDYNVNIYIQGYQRLGSCQEISISKIALKIFSEIIKKTNYSGFCCIDYKLIDNSPIIFEINPRIGGSLTRNKDVHLKFILAYSDLSIFL
jgi:carbamoylphosphate synthase large subunit